VPSIPIPRPLHPGVQKNRDRILTKRTSEDEEFS
jgi:hypothetical protein